MEGLWSMNGFRRWQVVGMDYGGVEGRAIKVEGGGYVQSWRCHILVSFLERRLLGRSAFRFDGVEEHRAQAHSPGVGELIPATAILILLVSEPAPP